MIKKIVKSKFPISGVFGLVVFTVCAAWCTAAVLAALLTPFVVIELAARLWL